MGILYNALCVPGTGQVTGDVYPQVFNAGDHLHSCASGVKERWGMWLPFLKSTITSFVFLTLMQRLLALHQSSSLGIQLSSHK